MRFASVFKLGKVNESGELNGSPSSPKNGLFLLALLDFEVWCFFGLIQRGDTHRVKKIF